jgi:hypothetical protein
MNREDTKPELPETPLLESKYDECDEVTDCRGDQFCDRGKCANMQVDEAGHGYGAHCKRVEEPNQLGTCLVYICVEDYCSSCLGDSECYADAPYCIKSPLWPNGKICSSEPSSYWYDDNGKLKSEREDEVQNAAAKYQQIQKWRKMVGLPIDAD